MATTNAQRMQNTISARPSHDGSPGMLRNPVLKFKLDRKGADAQAWKSAIGFAMIDKLLDNRDWIAFCSEVCRGLGHDPELAIRAINSYCRQNIDYQNELGERLASPDVTIRMGTGDCDDFAILGIGIANGIGKQGRFVFGELKAQPGWHVWFEIFNPRLKKWIPLDPCMPEGSEGFNHLDKFGQIVRFERGDVANIQIPLHLLYAETADPNEVIIVDNAKMNASGIQYMRAKDLELYPEGAAGDLLSTIQGIGSTIGGVLPGNIGGAIGNITGTIGQVSNIASQFGSGNIGGGISSIGSAIGSAIPGQAGQVVGQIAQQAGQLAQAFANGSGTDAIIGGLKAGTAALGAIPGPVGEVAKAAGPLIDLGVGIATEIAKANGVGYINAGEDVTNRFREIKLKHGVDVGKILNGIQTFSTDPNWQGWILFPGNIHAVFQPLFKWLIASPDKDTVTQRVKAVEEVWNLKAPGPHAKRIEALDALVAGKPIPGMPVPLVLGYPNVQKDFVEIAKSLPSRGRTLWWQVTKDRTNADAATTVVPEGVQNGIKTLVEAILQVPNKTDLNVYLNIMRRILEEEPTRADGNWSAWWDTVAQKVMAAKPPQVGYPQAIVDATQYANTNNARGRSLTKFLTADKIDQPSALTPSLLYPAARDSYQWILLSPDSAVLRRRLRALQATAALQKLETEDWPTWWSRVIQAYDEFRRTGFLAPIPEIVKQAPDLAQPQPTLPPQSTVTPQVQAALNAATPEIQKIAAQHGPEVAQEVMVKATEIVKAVAKPEVISEAVTEAITTKAAAPQIAPPLIVAPPTHSPITAAVAPAILSPANVPAVVAAAAQQIPRTEQVAVTQAIQNTRTLDALNNPKNADMLNLISDPNAKLVVKAAMEARQQQIEKASAVTAQKIVKGLTALPANVKQTLEPTIIQAMDTDQLLAVNDAFIRRIRDRLAAMPEGPAKSDGTLQYGQLASAMIKLIGDKDALVKKWLSVVIDSGDPEATSTTTASVLGRNLNDTMLLALSIGIDPEVWEAYKIQLADLHRRANALNTQIESLRYGMGA